MRTEEREDGEGERLFLVALHRLDHEVDEAGQRQPAGVLSCTIFFVNSLMSSTTFESDRDLADRTLHVAKPREHLK